jgi:hypothetical protein
MKQDAWYQQSPTDGAAADSYVRMRRLFDALC